MLKYLSLFSGIGGFELGINQAYEENNCHESTERDQTDGSGGISAIEPQFNSMPVCIGFSEIDKYATQIYQKHFPSHHNYGDITRIEASVLPSFDLIVGGFPCQSFSIAGKRGGFNDTRGTLFFEIARIIREKQPRLLLLENVKGLLSHDEGRTFTTIIATLDELGYDLQWQVLNSKNHGVPQNRERVYIVGHLRGTPRPEVFPFGEDDGVPPKENGSDEGRSQAEVSHTLRGPNVKADQSFIVHNVYGGFGEEKVREFKDHSPTIRTPQGGGHIPNVVTGMKIRRLTPIEGERLQGFPDHWTEGVSDSQRYKCIGNAVTVNVVEDIIKRLCLKK